jgi:hypothetical protein
VRNLRTRACDDPEDGEGAVRGSRRSRPLVSTAFGDEWPLIVAYAIVDCDLKTAAGRSLQIATLEAPDGKTYALNRTAKSHGDYADIDSIWAPDPDVSDLKISMTPLTDAALALR